MGKTHPVVTPYMLRYAPMIFVKVALYSMGVYSLVEWWRHSIMLWYRHEVTGSKQTHYTMNRVIMITFCVCFTNSKDTAFQWQIWSRFITVFWFRDTNMQDRDGILEVVWVLWGRFPKFQHSFLTYTFESSFNFYPIGITWRNMAPLVCLKPVSRKRWRLHTYWVRLTVPAYSVRNCAFCG